MFKWNTCPNENKHISRKTAQYQSFRGSTSFKEFDNMSNIQFYIQNFFIVRTVPWAFLLRSLEESVAIPLDSNYWPLIIY